MENAIDAGATKISIILKDAGKTLIQIIDNGCGIDPEDLEIAFQRHTSSKITSADELDAINTLGFRGEALASIAAVSQIEITSRTAEKENGMRLQIEGGKVISKAPCGAPIGTDLKVQNLFFNLPVRQKFLRSNRVEIGHITDIITRYALAYPLIHFALKHNNLSILNSPDWRGQIDHVINNNKIDISTNSSKLTEIYGFTVQTIYGKKISTHLLPIDVGGEDFRIFGFVGQPDIGRSEKNASSLFVNHRYVISKEFFAIMQDIYRDYLMRHKYPFFILFLEIAPNKIDCNVHPTKKKIKFLNASHFFAEIQQALSKPIKNSILMASQRNNLGESANVQSFDTVMDYWTPSSRTSNPSNSSNSSNPSISSQISHTSLSKHDSSIRVESSHQHHLTNPKQTHLLPTPKKIQKPRIKSPSSKYNKFKPQFSHELSSTSTSLENQSISESPYILVKNLPPLFKLNAGIQAGNNYLVFQNEEGLILIDQHAAHERINYERVQQWQKLDQVPIQRLILPIQLEVAPNEVEFVKDAAHELKSYGFELDHFGSKTFLLRTVPAILQPKHMDSQLIVDICLEIIKMGREKSFSDIKRDIFQYIGCHQSIRAGDEIWSESQIKKIIKDLDACENPHHCAHGRPTYIKISYKNIDKWFHRT
ncbi:MAG: DNA mismatch repair endonuclease MutL [Promethearchaeota archaeon]